MLIPIMIRGSNNFGLGERHSLNLASRNQQSQGTEGGDPAKRGNGKRAGHIAAMIHLSPVLAQERWYNHGMEALMIITSEQKQAVERAGSEPVPIQDPEDGSTYFLIREDVYRKLRGLSNRPTPL